VSLYQSLQHMVKDLAVMVRPADRVTVSEWAAKNRYLNNPGSFVGFWDNDVAPYLIEPMNETSSLSYTGMIFVGPARTGKSDMFFNYLGYTADCDPADMMLIHMTQNTARDWSQRDLGRFFRQTKAAGDALIPGRQNDNVHDKKFKSGMNLLIKWPVITELSGKTIPRLWLMDYDRMPEDIGGEGNPFDLARKRAQTLKRFGMCVAESSPGHEIDDPNWLAKSPNEAPPTKGLLALYNRGDRRRWQWPCPQCGEHFEADFEHFSYPDLGSEDFMEAAEQVTLTAPCCGYPIEPSLKRELNIAGRWVKDGMVWTPEGNMEGRPRRTDIASFWLKGPAAAFQDWSSLVLKYLQAKKEYDDTGSEEALKVTTNTDQGKPYLPQSIRSERLPEHLKARAKPWGGTADDPIVPEGVRFLIATIDVQKNAFVVQVHGFGLGGDIWIIDMFKIRRSETRFNDDGERELIDPAAYAEDWSAITTQVLDKTYPLADGSGRMAIKATGCDSGGRAGVTANAYDYWRLLRDTRDDNSHIRFQLIKGDSSPRAPRIRLEYPDSQKKDKRSMARGDIPVLLINTNIVKDQVSGKLNRDDAGGMVNYPDWSPDWLYAQLCAEIRTAKGWENPRGRRNEAWDLLVYAISIGLHTRQVAPNIERLDWSNPPSWADVWENNSLIVRDEITKVFQTQLSRAIDLSELASQLA
jgi:phage terminase large subunit GpA-like protein